jgi:hypothetical protein
MKLTRRFQEWKLERRGRKLEEAYAYEFNTPDEDESELDWFFDVVQLGE